MPFIDTILDLLFPSRCVECGAYGTDLCLICLSDCPPAERESAAWIFPIYDYRHPTIKKSLWLLKYKGKKKMANIFAEILYERISEELSELSVMENFHDPLLIPIPLSPTRRHERGYNQAELICQQLIALENSRDRKKKAAPFTVERVHFTLKNNILIKPKETEHQARIKDRRERLKNIKGSFAISGKGEIQGRNIILIDDILTTGATLSEAKKVLKQSGARKVIAFTVAH